MKNTENKMSLDSFMKIAENAKTIDVLDAVQGGALSECHNTTSEEVKKGVDDLQRLMNFSF